MTSIPAEVPAEPRRLYVAQLRPSVSIWGRLFSLALALGCLTVLIIAARLEPSPTGVGSHREMGLQSCQLLNRSGLPCPSCGMTTSFTWFVRGNLVASAYVQPMGMVVALATACCVWIGAYIAITGRPVHRLLLQLPARAWLIGLLSFTIAAWAWKIFIHLNGMDGW
jgi:hypothetical protein